jgi:hypothetical protein
MPRCRRHALSKADQTPAVDKKAALHLRLPHQRRRQEGLSPSALEGPPGSFQSQLLPCPSRGVPSCPTRGLVTIALGTKGFPGLHLIRSVEIKARQG